MLIILNIYKMAVGRGQPLPRGLHRSSRAVTGGRTNRHANEINPSVCKQDWWGAAVGSRLARALRAEQVTTLIVCSYSFDIDEEGAAHNRVERYINNSFIGRELPLLLQ